MRALWLVNQLWFIVPVNSWKFCMSSELLYKSNRPQVFMVYRLINHLGCWKNTRRISKRLACGSWVTNSSRVLPISRMVYQSINHKYLWSIALLFLHRFLFLLFSSSVSLFYVSVTALSQPCCKLPRVVIWHDFDVWRYEFANFLKFANTSLPTYLCCV